MALALAASAGRHATRTPGFAARPRDARGRARAGDGGPGPQRGAPSPTAGDPRLALERVLDERALKSSLTSLDVKDSRVYVTFSAIGFEALIGMLDALAKTDGMRPVAATLTPRVEQGSVRAEITLARLSGR